MSKQLLFYSNAVAVSSSKHAGLYVKSGGDYEFARTANAVPLTAVEFRRTSLEYAVVFAGQGDDVMPMVILGTEAEQNLYVKDDGAWDARYVPAFVRRYPFVFASNNDGKTFALCIDEAFGGCNTEGRGERLFDADGERTQYLQTVLNFVNEYQQQFDRTRAFCARLREHDLLEPMQAQFRLGDGEPRSLTGFMAVNRAKLKELDDAVLVQMAKNDELELVYLHLQSLQNFNAVLSRIGAQPQGDAAAEGDAPADDAPNDGVPSLH